MYKINIDWEKLRAGEKVICPECKKGYLVTQYDPKLSHSFECNNCGMKINKD